KKYQRIRLIALAALILPGCIVMGFTMGPLLGAGGGEIASILTVLWFVAIAIAFIEFSCSLGKSIDSFRD
ncbi:MAG: hypothetical protein KTR15_09075, partial [Phycisphaeraceae bacterium]|nr:hypothetical protein [Phycisphaeraceae bacterium]